MLKILNQVDLSLVISLAALFLAVLSPIVSGILTGHYSVKIRKMETEDARRQRIENEERQKQEAEAAAHQSDLDRRNCVIRDYIRSAGRAYYGGGFTEFGENMSEIYLYLDESYWLILDKIKYDLEQEQFGQYSGDLIMLIKKLSAEYSGNQE